MTKNILYSLLFATMSAFAASCSDDDDMTPVNYDQLPAQAQTFLSMYFPTGDIYSIESDYDDMGGYSVEFTDGTEVDFDSSGQWTEVDAAMGCAVPDAIVPVPILSYVSNNFPNQYITDIERTAWGFSVDTSGDIELAFGPDGTFMYYEN